MIAENVQTIRERIAAGMDEPFEIIVVSDGSVDGTAERVIERDLADVRVLYYDRNLGKGYAVKTGAREARGRWVGYVDADLDLDPAALPGYVETCRARRPRLRDRLEAPSGLEGDLPALARRRIVDVPAVRPGVVPASTSATRRSGSRSSGARWRRR